MYTNSERTQRTVRSPHQLERCLNLEDLMTFFFDKKLLLEVLSIMPILFVVVDKTFYISTVACSRLEPILICRSIGEMFNSKFSCIQDLYTGRIYSTIVKTII